LAIAVIGGLVAVLALHPAHAQDSSDDWVQIFDQNAVSFGQIAPTDADSDVTEWRTGVLFVDYELLAQDLMALGRRGGFIQVVEFETDPINGQWEVANFPVLDPNVLTASSEAFSF